MTQTLPQPAEHEIIGRGGEPYTLYGQRLAFSSSRRDSHTHLGDFAPPGWKCSRCRWFEVGIYRLGDGDETHLERCDPAPPINGARYVVHTVGRSIIPNEIDYARVAWAESPHRVIELLVMQREGHRPKIPEASATAIDEAASLDPAIDDAYDSWVAAGVR